MRSIFKRSIALIALLSLFGQGCTKGITPEAQQASKVTTLNVWSVVDDEDAYNPVFNDFRVLHPNAQINFRRLRLEEYETELLNALAEDRGPDVFLIHNDWTDKYLPKVVPMPTTVRTAARVTTGTIKKETTYQMQNESLISNKSFKDQFADVVIKDTMRVVNTSAVADKPVMQERAVGVPVGIDTMALYYNKDLLNAAGIPNAPETWGDFQAQVKKLTKLDAQGNVVQSAAGIGTAYNVERAVDLLSVLMMQNGANMENEDGSPTFHIIPPALQDVREESPGLQALGFYTAFADPNKEFYTWNGSQPNSLDAFLQGRSAFFFGYAYHLPQIKARAPRLNLGISKLPQIAENPTKNYANYWYWVVSKKTKNSDLAWSLLNFFIKPEESKKILDLVKRPAARKSLLMAQLEDEEVGVFASQVLTANSWYRGIDPQAMEDAMLTMINDVVTGSVGANEAMKFAVQKIAQTIAY